MTKKVFILSIVLSFFVSITGFPVTIHLCNMIKNPAKCEMMNHKTMTQHCKNDLTDLHYSSRLFSKCCTIKTIDSSIKDNFITVNSELKINLSISALESPSINIQECELNTGSLIYLTDPSPPGLITNHIYLNNSSFLI